MGKGPVLPPRETARGPAAPCLTLAVPAASPPRGAVLECSRVCSLDYTVVLGLRELLEDFRRQGLPLALVGLQVGVPEAGVRAPHAGTRVLRPREAAAHPARASGLRALLVAVRFRAVLRALVCVLCT